MMYGMRTLAMPILLLLLAASGFARAAVVADLYRGEAIVTGQENLEERQRGFREALAEAVVKVSGDARLAGDPRLAPALAEAGRFVARFTYEDRLAKKKLMDEQGTRERSYILRVEFDPVAVDALLVGLGARPWTADRPRLLVLLVVEDSVGVYLLGEDSARGWGQREALNDIARRRGLPVVLPRIADEDRSAGLAGRAAGEGADAGTTARAAALYDVAAVLRGSMRMRPDGLWDTRWTLAMPGGGESSQTDATEGTTFDRAIAAGLAGAARQLAGIG